MRWPAEKRNSNSPQMVIGSDRSPSDHWMSGIKVFHLNAVSSHPYQNIIAPKTAISRSETMTKMVRSQLGTIDRKITTERCVFSFTPAAAPRNAITMTRRRETCSTQVGVSFST